MNYRYQNIPTVKRTPKSPQYYVNNIYPEIPLSGNDDYVITVLGDRMDLLAFDFYGDTSYWWVIASANSLPGDSLYLEPGMQLRIPYSLPEVLNLYRVENALR